MEKIPENLRKNGIFYTDLWKAYKGVILKERHIACETRAETNHIERFNGTLRSKLSRLVRRSYSFSKKLKNLICHLNIHIHDYNLKRYQACLKRQPQLAA